MSLSSARGYADDPGMDGQRSSGGSGRSSGGRSGKSASNPSQQLSTIEKSVTHLLVATKQLLETLTMWSRGTASESEVSDVYVRLGYEFNIACRAFSAIGVDTSDLGPVPDLLRTILEDTLSQEASQQSLDKFLPRIRDIIINLLHGLKKKQQRLRQKGGGASVRENSAGALPPRQASVASNVSLESSLTQQLEDVPSRQSSSRSFVQRQGSGGELAMPELPPRTTSVQSGTGRSSPRRHGVSPQNSMHVSNSRDTMASDSSSLSSNALQNIPVIAPYPEQDTILTNNQMYSEPQRSPSPEPPRPPPKQNDALSALQRGGDLERRASRRFSAYQIQKHLGTSMNGIAAIPPAQHSPVPNRGRDVRESLSAVRSRGSVLHSRARSKNAGAHQPSPSNDVRRISEESSQGERQPQQRLDTQLQPTRQDDQQLGSPMVKTPEDKLGSYPFPETPSSPDKASATLNGPMEEPFYYGTDSPMREKEPEKAPIPKRSDSRKAVPQVEQRTPPQSTQFVPESSPQPGKELTLFLQYKSKIKKFVLPGGSDDLTLARLQLGFIEKFAWNTQNNGTDLPEIYIQDPVSGVRHELEDLADVKERSVLVLNVEALDEVKRHFDEGLGGLRRVVETIKDGVLEQGTKLERVSERQTEMSREVAGLAAAPAAQPSQPSLSSGTKGPLSAKDKRGQMTELQALRRDLAVVRQTYTSFVSDMQASMATIRAKAASVKKAAVDAPIPDMDPNTGRGYVNSGKKTLSDDSEKIVNKVDDLQDMVEDLRKDVVTRGVRPLPRQLESVSKDISQATKDLKKLQEFLRREKPVWTKIWEKELQVVCDDRDLLTLQEELAVDLEDDLEKAAATFALVEQATKQQNLAKPGDAADAAAAGTPATARSASGPRLPPIALGAAAAADPLKAKDSVLGEVRALQPNHESRLEAIERAERARQRELESRRGGEFQRELGNFVEEGRLKKTGGVEEVERVRKMREEKARREVVERQQARMRERAEREAGGAGGGGEGEANGAPPETEAEGEGKLDVPAPTTLEGEHAESSPEPGFVDATQDVGTPGAEAPPPASAQ